MERLQFIVHRIRLWYARINDHKTRNFSEGIGHHTRISNQLQTRGRTRLNHTLERNRVPRNSRQHENDNVRVGNRRLPDRAFFILCLELLTSWSRDIEHSECTGNVEE